MRNRKRERKRWGCNDSWTGEGQCQEWGVSLSVVRPCAHWIEINACKIRCFHSITPIPQRFIFGTISCGKRRLRPALYSSVLCSVVLYGRGNNLFLTDNILSNMGHRALHGWDSCNCCTLKVSPLFNWQVNAKWGIVLIQLRWLLAYLSRWKCCDERERDGEGVCVVLERGRCKGSTTRREMVCCLCTTWFTVQLARFQ
jgi:hypothetical protein